VKDPLLSDRYEIAKINFISSRSMDIIHGSYCTTAHEVMILIFAVFYLSFNDGPYNGSFFTFIFAVFFHLSL